MIFNQISRTGMPYPNFPKIQTDILINMQTLIDPDQECIYVLYKTVDLSRLKLRVKLNFG